MTTRTLKNHITTDTGIEITIDHDTACVSHHQLAKVLGVQALSLFKLISTHQQHVKALGVLRFQIDKPRKGTTGGRPEKIAYLNEDQSYFVLSLSRNTLESVNAKLNLVKAFKAARAQLAMRHEQYLPLHHEAHTQVSCIASKAREAGSKVSESMFHMNIEKLINKVFGIAPNSRQTLQPQTSAAISTAYAIYQEVSTYVINQGLPANDAYALAKQKIEQLADLLSMKRLTYI